MVSAEKAACERGGGFPAAPAVWHPVASVAADGRFSWAEGGIGPTVGQEIAMVNGQPYRFHGWALLLTTEGTRLSNVKQRPRHERLHRRSDSHALLIAVVSLPLPSVVGAARVAPTRVHGSADRRRYLRSSSSEFLRKRCAMALWRRSTDAVPDDAPTTTELKRDVGAELEVDVTSPTTLAFQIAVTDHPGAQLTESLTFTCNGKAVTPDEIIGQHGNRIHRFAAPEGTVTASYQATILGQADPAPVRDIDLITYLWPSRYAEADKFFGFAATEFEEFVDSATLLEKVSSWVGTRRSTCRDPATRSTARSTPCSPAKVSAATTPIWWSRCYAR